ncbi:phage virion morphogenesis protein [Agitococcus lubricus]|uniref:Phage virion morphogenesis protein n=1 Tax=Agitococcus lubricus TaxID=1077255 RepID=A0A2T5J1G5_9GAMM|nr:phage virion morphogenesis protein [Agitococcus lubricus]PTQ90285.1 phage virion morphogenesis protein [Agitococcus lubricus]
MSDNFSELATWAAPLLAKLNGSARRQLMRELAKGLRKRQSDRIKAQQNVDGSAYVPRKPQRLIRSKQGRIKQTLFNKLTKASHLKIAITDGSVAVGFDGRTARIARVHQLGLRDKVSRYRNEYDYPKRELLGFSDDDKTWARDFLIDHLTR